jgi:predicted ATP-grasp superfamily ATP-dependent carboligase
MALLNITDADRKMAINSAMVGAGAVTSISVANWVKSQSWAPKLVTDHIDITTALAGIPVYSLGRKQKGQLKDIVQSLGAGMVVGGVYRALLSNTQVRDFLGLSLYDSADARTPIANKPLELDVPAGTAVFNGSRLGAYSSHGLSPVQGALGAYQTNPSSRMFSR